MASNLRIYLRVDEISGGAVSKNRFLFIPVEEITKSWNIDVIKPAVPGNGPSQNYGGNTSTNLMIALGRVQLSIKVKGTLQQLESTDFPSLPTNGTPRGADSLLVANPVYDNSNQSTPGSTATYSDPMSAERYREALDEYVLGQSLRGTRRNWRLGWGNYRTITSPEPTYKEYHGLIAGNVTINEEAGVPNQYPFEFTFVVGRPFDILV